MGKNRRTNYNALILDLKLDRIGLEKLDTEGQNRKQLGIKHRYGKDNVYFIKRDYDSNLLPVKLKVPSEKPKESAVSPETAYRALVDVTAAVLYSVENPIWTPARLKGLFIILGVAFFVLWMIYMLARRG